MGTLRVSDHALLRFLDRSAGIPVEQLRESLARSLDKAHDAAVEIGARDYFIAATDGPFLVRNGVVVTVLEDEKPGTTLRRLRRMANER
ncbi:hypothetical protein VO57_008765 [Citromicrobium bathyomarinum]|nr:hypothetical protein [Citromicrobium sp. JL2201]KPM22272.1 hypothetical protein VO57_12550 [Citromicrobium sp. JL2201]